MTSLIASATQTRSKTPWVLLSARLAVQWTTVFVTVGAAVARAPSYMRVRRGRKGFVLYFSIISKWCHAGGELLYRCQPPHYPTLICIIIMVSPTEHPGGGRPALRCDSRLLNRSARPSSQPQKRLQINVTFLRALIWTLPHVSYTTSITYTLPRSPGGRIQLSRLLFRDCSYFFVFCSRGEVINCIYLFSWVLMSNLGG